MMETGRSGADPFASGPRAGEPCTVRHAIRDQDRLWTEFLAMSRSVLDGLEKSIQALCDGRIEVTAEVKALERESDREEFRIERQCLRVLALFEPVASDLRRMATILKVTRDWERIADLAARVARRARKLAQADGATPIPEPLKTLGRTVLEHSRLAYEALAARDAKLARVVIRGEAAIDRLHRQVRKDLKQSLRPEADTLDLWLQMLNTARNLERIADHASDIALTVVYLEEGLIIRHQGRGKRAGD